MQSMIGARAVKLETNEHGIVFEEDREKALNLCISMFGPIGKYAIGKGVSGVITGRKCGPLWYGDILQEEFNKLNTLQELIDDEVTVVQ